MRRCLCFGSFAIAIALATGAAAAEPREFCSSRPGLGTPPCTVEPGRAVFELGLADWERDDQPDMRTDKLVYADMLARVGLDDVTEAQVGWTAFGSTRTRDRMTGQVMRERGIGDVRLGLRRSLSGPDGNIAIQPFVTLPTGGNAIGAGDWGAGVVVPMAFELGKDLTLAFSPEIDAAVDEDRSGRHLAYGGVVGLSAKLTDKVNGTVEVQVMRDDDPSGRKTMAVASTSIAWMVGDDTQLDLGTNIGLNRASADAQVYVGIARRF